ncbi:MAG TPA: glycosyl hydrolase, partial [Thermoanaerobaculia bacterium]|nr:glycosyl hydrolase [Thermoanaerobaculia bacterium]
QYLLRSDDGGMSWREISPDLTRNDKSKQGTSGGPVSKDNASAEYYDLIYAIAPSPLASGQIWVGTDDGLIQLTRDGGKSWANVTPKGLPEWAKVSMIEASHFDAGTAYAAVDAHKLDDFNPYIFITHDYGKSWSRENAGFSAPAFLRAVREDPKEKNLLYAATETGVYVSFDQGKRWQTLELNLPVTSVRDLVVKNGDLVAATHGRGFWILDDISPLREIAAGANAESDRLYAPREAIRLHSMAGGGLPYESVGENPPDGAILYYSLAGKTKGAVTLTVSDAAGTVLKTFSTEPKPVENDHPLEFPSEEHEKPEKLDAKPGLNRAVWDLRHEKAPEIEGAYYDMGGPVSPMVLPGRYTVTLTVDGKTSSQPLTVVKDPRTQVTEAALEQQYELMVKLDQAIRQDHEAANAIIAARASLESLHKRLAADQSNAALVKLADEAKTLDQKLSDVLEDFYQYHAQAEEAELNYPTKLNSQLAYLEELVDSADSAPTAQEVQAYALLRTELDAALARWQEAQAGIAAFNAKLAQAGVGPVPAGSRKK